MFFYLWYSSWKYLLFSFLVNALAFATFFPASAQIDDPSRHRYSIGIAYFGELFTHPGAILFGEFGFWGASGHSVEARVNIGLYRHTSYNINYVILPELLYSFRWDRSVARVSIGLGGLFSKPDGMVYAINSNGTFDSVENTGLWYAAPTASVAYGIRCELEAGKAIEPFIGLRAVYRTPFNGSGLFHPVGEIGVRYPLVSP